MTNKQIKILATGQLVAKLKKGKKATFIKPVAQDIAALMFKHYKYVPIIHDVFTLKPNSYYENN